jgi:hydroxyquinol 1,2-dioxygenase
MTIKAFTEDNSAELFIERLSAGGGTARILGSLVSHLHAFVREVRPTNADWRDAVAFLTEVGHAADDRRQEWALASDLLGVTALVEEINSRRPKGATPNTVRGPFYRPNAPRVANGASICQDGKGEDLVVSGRIVDLDGSPVSGATIETWQANGEGLYENQQPDSQPDFNLRATLTAGPNGGFGYHTIRPAGYAAPDDGPIGRLLAELGMPLRRPAHLHFIISAEGFETISTHVFDSNDPALANDALFGVKPELIGQFKAVDKGFAVDFTFVMARAKSERRAA